MDFVADALFDGHRLRALTVIDNYTRECLAIEVGQSLKGDAVVQVLSRITAGRGKPQTIKVDNVLNASRRSLRSNSDPDRAAGAVDLLNSSTTPSTSGLPRSCGGALPDHSGHKIQRVGGVIFTVPKTA